MQQKENFQKKLDAFIETLAKDGLRPRILVHSCCAPCSSYVAEYLSKYFDIDLYFYNPNMDTEEEYQKRAAELERLIRDMGLSGRTGVIVADYDPEHFMEIARGHEDDPERGERCTRCYELRLRETARYMKEHNSLRPDEAYDYFATTLTLSPLKDAARLNEISRKAAADYSVRCLETDFKKRDGYKRSIELSREYGLYRQDYCGCKYSKKRRDRK